MDPSLFSRDDGILFLGEGNFSFSLKFKQQHADKLRCVIATCFEDEDKILEGAKENVQLLKESGVSVLYGIDARQLTSYNQLVAEDDLTPNCIIFNFPHIGGKMKINRNRELLQDFFSSARKFLAGACARLPQTSRPKIIVNLCKGQGGTPADGDNQRDWGNSWQINEMAAISGFILSQVLPFNHKLCNGYESVGFRSREQWFHTTEAIVHVFEPAAPILLVSRINEKETSVQLSTRYGDIVCDRTHLDLCSAFTEMETKYFLSSNLKISPQVDLYNKLVDLVKNSARLGENLMVVHTNYLPFNCDLNLKRVPCSVGNTAKFMRRSLADVMEFCKKENFITYGPIFKPLDELSFNESPAPYQILVKHTDIERLTGLITLWLSSLIGETRLEVEMDDDQWTVQFSGQDLAYKCQKNAVIIELDLLAMIYFQAENFRDLLFSKRSNSTFSPVSLFPRTFVLDICFVIGEAFSEKRFNVLLWRLLGKFLIGKELVNKYSPEDEDWTSHCYRLQYRSSLEALSKRAAIVLHQEFLPEALLNSKLAQKVM
ncbi:uncharacterized protein LOC135947251 [Cloeon dipterum]|uniref:uncharacterized protein LOC135947251 n=1 Tax=Cloeon dipterum TaxID=197152 RepID=UPI00321F9A79